MKVCINGKFVLARDAKVSVFDPGFTGGYGIYETLLAENGEVFDLEAHVERLFNSARMIDLNLPWTKGRIEKWTIQLCNEVVTPMRIRITVSFEPTLVIFALPLNIPGERKNYKVITYEIERILPEVKTTCLMPQWLARREMARKKADEVLLVNRRDEITEGSVTNVFFVRALKVITPKEGILKGIMREKVIKIAKKLQIPVVERAVKKSEKFDECFVTNSLRFIVPVLSIDRKKVSSSIGPITKLIQDEIRKG